jgi:hypothetical protein
MVFTPDPISEKYFPVLPADLIEGLPSLPKIFTEQSGRPSWKHVLHCNSFLGGSGNRLSVHRRLLNGLERCIPELGKYSQFF